MVSDKEYKEKAGLEWDTNPKLREEFLSKDNYIAYRVSELKGLARICPAR